MRAVVAGLFLVVLTTAAMPAVGQGTPEKLRWALHLNETRGPVRTADVSPFLEFEMKGH